MELIPLRADMLFWAVCCFILLLGAIRLIGSSFMVSMKKMPSKLFLAGYRIVYTDQKESRKKDDIVYSTLLYSLKYDIQGKPDYIFQNNISRRLIPVEIKSGSIGDNDSPHKGDLLQLAAYFLIIEEVYGRRPKAGRLMYRDYMFEVKNNRAIRREVKKTLSQMRRMLKSGRAAVNPSFALCRHCICNNTVCEFCERHED